MKQIITFERPTKKIKIEDIKIKLLDNLKEKDVENTQQELIKINDILNKIKYNAKYIAFELDIVEKIVIPLEFKNKIVFS